MKDVWGIADQALISATNFATMVLVARGLGGPAEFGAFSLVYAALLFANLLQVSLVTQPHNILGAVRHGGDYREFTTSCGIVQLMMVLIEAIVVLAAFLVGVWLQWPAAGMLLALAPAVVAWQLQEFVRRVMYTEGRHAAGFANDLISYGGQTVAIGILWLMDVLGARGVVPPHHHLLTGAVALYVLAATSALGVLVGVWQVRNSLSHRIIFSAIRENWQFGKWLAAADVLTWCSSLHMYLYLAAAILGTAATGELRAAQILFGPTRVLAYYLDTVLPIRFARTLGKDGATAMYQTVWSVLRKVSAPLAVYCLLAAVCARPLLKLTFGVQYAGAASVLVLYSAYSLITYVQMIFAAAVRARRQTRFVFAGSVMGVLVALFVGWAFVLAFGVNGVLLTMMATGAAVTVLYIYVSCQGIAAPGAKLFGSGQPRSHQRGRPVQNATTR